MKMKNKQTTPKWFDGSIYDFIMGCNQMWAMGMEPKKETVNDFEKALTWFRTNNTKAYMALLD